MFYTALHGVVPTTCSGLFPSSSLCSSYSCHPQDPREGLALSPLRLQSSTSPSSDRSHPSWCPQRQDSSRTGAGIVISHHSRLVSLRSRPWSVNEGLEIKDEERIGRKVNWTKGRSTAVIQSRERSRPTLQGVLGWAWSLQPSWVGTLSLHTRP